MQTAGLPRQAPPILGQGNPDWDESKATIERNPANHQDVVGQVMYATAQDVEQALEAASHYAPIWQATPVEERAAALQQAAQLLEDNMQDLMGLLVREAGKSYANAIAEVREAVDFLRYYAGQVLRISRRNFPLAFCLGQVSAAVAAGYVALAKPAERTCRSGAAAVELLHKAGIAPGALQLLPGDGPSVGAPLAASEQVNAVMFTGSTAVAMGLNRQLAKRLTAGGQAVPLIAETGGLNAMVVDSSALPEQVVFDVLNSAFDSAGQRCSALRLLCIQEDVAERVLNM